jgi:hypothetical protein
MKKAQGRKKFNSAPSVSGETEFLFLCMLCTPLIGSPLYCLPQGVGDLVRHRSIQNKTKTKTKNMRSILIVARDRKSIKPFSKRFLTSRNNRLPGMVKKQVGKTKLQTSPASI